MDFTHFNEQGRARMVDVTDKAPTFRTATAMASVKMAPETAVMASISTPVSPLQRAVARISTRSSRTAKRMSTPVRAMG